MKRLLFLPLLLLALTGLGWSQTTAVTLQVTDGDGQTWNGGSWSVSLSRPPGTSYTGPFTIAATGQVVPNQVQNGALSGTGGASITLTPNSAIGAASFWSFQVCPQASASCYVQQVTVVGTTQTVTLAPPAIRISMSNPPPLVLAYTDTELLNPSTGQQYFNVVSLTQRQWSGSAWGALGGGGGVSSGAALPTSGCTVGQLFNLVSVANGNTTLYHNTTTSGTGCAFSPTNPFVNAADYGAVGEGHFTFNATASNSTNIVTCASCHFLTNAAVGQIFYATNLGVGGFTPSSALVDAQGTITSIDSDTQIHVSQTFTAGCSLTLCMMIWGTDESTQLQNAWNANLNSCSTLNLPGVNPEGTGPAVILVSVNQFGNPSGLCAGTGGSRSGLGIQGQGFDSTYIMPVPNFPASSCTIGTDGAACFAMTTDGGHYRQFTIHGGGVSNPGAGFSGKVGFQVDCLNNCYINDMQLLFWGAFTTNGIGTGIRFKGGEIFTYNFGEDGWGEVGRELVAGSNLGAIQEVLPVGYDNGSAEIYDHNASNNYNTLMGTWGTGSSANGIAGLCNGAPWHSVQDNFGNQGGAGLSANGVLAGFCFIQGGSTTTGSGTIYLDHANIYGSPSATSQALLTNSATNSLYVSNSNVTLTGSAGCFLLTNSGNFYDNGGNNFTKGSCGLYNGAGTVFGSRSFTGTTVVAGNLAASANWGTGAAFSAITGTQRRTQFTLTNGSASVGASPTITFTFPKPFFVAPICTAVQVSGNNPLTATANFSPTTITATSAIFTYNGTPTINDTELIQVTCDLP